ncbi:MAG: lipofamily protein, partial [Turicibacter sanguinis]
MNTTKDLTFEGGLKKDGVETPRLLALYNQDENRNKTASYTLTAPKMTFKEDGSRIKGGTVAGDIYVDCNNFELVDATVNGNIYFKDQAAKDSFK